MSDIRYDTYQHYGTNADRLLFVPAPPNPAISQPIYVWYETDTNTVWLYDTSWHLIGGSGSGSISTASIPVTNAEMIALPTTPKVLVAAPGAGFYYDLLSASIALDTLAGAYTNVDTGATINDLPSLQIQTPAGVWLTSAIYNDLSMIDPSSGLPITALTGFLNVVRVAVIKLVPAAFSDVYPNGWGILSYASNMTNYENIGISLGMYNLALGNLTGGNAANGAVVNLTYVKVAVP